MLKIYVEKHGFWHFFFFFFFSSMIALGYKIKYKSDKTISNVEEHVQLQY